MGIDVAAVGRSTGPHRFAWTDRDTLLYALGIGAGTADLAFTTENSHGRAQRVFPTFAAVALETDLILEGLGTFDPAALVFGGISLRLHAPLLASGQLNVTATVVEIRDKGVGRGAVAVTRTEGADPESGRLLAESTATYFVRQGGGFGGAAGAADAPFPMPERDADAIVEFQTRDDQALIYRLSGDRNPLHSDPWFASRRSGFDRPILHGLCTFGYAGRALLGALCQDDAARVEAIEARFVTPVFPGDALTVRMWITESGTAVFTVEAHSSGDDQSRLVLDHGRFRYAPRV